MRNDSFQLIRNFQKNNKYLNPHKTSMFEVIYKFQGSNFFIHMLACHSGLLPRSIKFLIFPRSFILPWFRPSIWCLNKTKYDKYNKSFLSQKGFVFIFQKFRVIVIAAVKMVVQQNIRSFKNFKTILEEILCKDCQVSLINKLLE